MITVTMMMSMIVMLTIVKKMMMVTIMTLVTMTVGMMMTLMAMKMPMETVRMMLTMSLGRCVGLEITNFNTVTSFGPLSVQGSIEMKGLILDLCHCKRVHWSQKDQFWTVSFWGDVVV